MLFQNKPSVILYLRRQDAVLITKNLTARVSIPLEVVYNLEVRDAATLTEVIARFLHDNKIHGQPTLLVLDPSIVFEKSLGTQAATQAAFDDFSSKVPFDPETKQLLTVRQKDQLLFCGVNKVLYQTVAAGIRQANKLKGVVPAFAYGLQDGKKVDKSIVTSFFQNARPLKEANFLAKA